MCGGARGNSRTRRDSSTKRRFDDLTAAELANLHDAIDDVDDYRIWRIGGSLGLVAASILIIGMAWLNAMPSPGRTSGGQTPLRFRRHPRILGAHRRHAARLPAAAGDVDAIQPHDAQLADYMLEGLALGK